MHRFEELPVSVAYETWRLRQRVFVVEQDCPYEDLDGRDSEESARHVLLTQGERVMGCLRVLDDGDAWRIGRVVLDPSVRGGGNADRMIEEGLADARARDATRDAVLDAQSPLVGWYARFGFVPDGDEFLEDGIPHTPMRLTARS